MLDPLKVNYRKLRENNAFSIFLHPRVIANLLLLREEQRRRPVVMWSRPVGIEIELTNRCNLACIQCLRSRGLRRYGLGEMSFDVYRTVLAQFPFVTNLSLNGFGEALMHRRFFDAVTYSRRRLPWAKIGIYSNGLLIDDERAERLPRSGLTELNVSIDAAEAATYARVRRGGALRDVHEGIRRLVRARRAARSRFPMIGMNFVMLNENEGELVQFVEQAADLGVDFINTVSYATYDWGFENTRSPSSYRRELDAARERARTLGVRCKTFPSGDMAWSSPQNPFCCSYFWGENIRVTYDGHVTLGCCTPFKEMYSYGNLLETPFEQIWNGETFRRNRAMAREHRPPNETCASCDRFCKSFFDRVLEEGGRDAPAALPEQR
jgi:MoaA/NifB/PqqE/SkfB family radical SAM enzyme